MHELSNENSPATELGLHNMPPSALDIGDALQSRDVQVKPVDRSTAETVPLLAGFPRAQLDSLLRFGSIQRYPRGTTLFEEGEYADKLHIVLSGTVEIFSTCRGREWGLFLMNSGDILMPVAIMYSEPYLNSARTVTSSRLLLLDAERVREQAAASADFAIRLARSIAGQLRMSMRQVLELKCRNAAQRLGSFLLKLSDREGIAAELPMPKRNLAARIGMTPETLSRTLQVLADNGLVVRGRQIIIRDRRRIEQFCGPDPCPISDAERLKINAL
jgi:CRP/FNR family transcriptional activator FtrB